LNTAGSPSQVQLAELFADRAAWAGNGPRRDEAREVTALVLLRSLDLAGLVQGARAFAASLDADEAAAWRGSWTKTRFLFGNPANLTERTPPRVVAGGGTAAWLGPYPAGRLPGLSRLLKPVTGVLPKLPGEVETGGPGGPAGRDRFRELRIALRDLTLAGYLVHLHHTLAESVLLARLGRAEPLRLVHRPDIAITPGGADYARVHFAPGDPSALRLYTCLAPAGRPAPGYSQISPTSLRWRGTWRYPISLRRT
jgi:hypothetical protein